MEKQQVIFIGGIHGAGKSSICHENSFSNQSLILKQRYLLREVAEECGLYSWEEIGKAHYSLIEEAAYRAVAKIREYSLALFDCHYAIRTNKALRLVGRATRNKYIADLDDKLVAVIGMSLKIRFILVQTLPELAAKRIASRSLEIPDNDNSLKYLVRAERVEKKFFLEKIYNHQVDQKDYLIINNNGSRAESCLDLENFIYQGYA